jgi:GNAT superfamily N-acetyltransferase
MALPSPSELRELFDVQVRQNTSPDGSGSSLWRTGTTTRSVAENSLGWSEVMWSQLTSENVDAVIEQEIVFFRDRNQSFVWRTFDHDLPTDLSERLVAKGFALTGTSTVMVGDASALAGTSALPEGLDMLQVVDERGIDLFIHTNESVFGHEHEGLRASLRARLDNAPWEMESLIVMHGDQPVSAGRIEFLPERDFAFLWGGGTQPEWRGKGLYTALVQHRAVIARERGYTYLAIFASSQSQPILSKLGFVPISMLTGHEWKPSA